MADTQPVSLGKRLRQERERRHWTQEYLAEKIGGSVTSINRWEHDRATPRQDLLALLTEVFGRPPERWGTSRQIHWNVPFLRDPYFTGRERILLRLHQALAAEQTVALSQTRALSGLGGIGKTQTAIEYAYRYADEYEAVLWVRADSSESLLSGFAALAAVLDLPAQQERDQHYVVSAVKRWLEEHGPWLLIFDNADDPELVSDFLPRHAEGAILLTTRSQATGPHIKKIEMEKISREEGIAFLLRRIHAGDEERFSPEVSQQEREAAEQLWECMDGLPLALDQAAAYIEETGCTLGDYLTMFKTRSKDLLLLRGQIATAHPESVATTWLLAFEKVERPSPAAAELLRFCAFLHPDEIPEAMLIAGAGASALGPALQSKATDDLEWNKAIGELRKYSLVKRDAEKKILNIHRLVQAMITDEMDKETLWEYAERVTLAVNAAFPHAEHNSWQQCELLLPHALLAAQYIERYHIISEEAGRLLHEMASYLHDRARYSEAELLYQRARQIREQYLGPEHPEVATSLFRLAELYRAQNKYIEAEPLFQQASRIREQHPDLGPEHPEMAASLAGLANLYRDMQRFTEAEELYKRARDIFEQHLGYAYPQVGQVLSDQGISYARVLNSLGALNKDKGRFTEAEQLYNHARGIFEQHLGPRHRLMAFPVNNLAILYKDQHKYDKAEPLYQLELTINEEQLGTEHPEVALSCNNLAEFYRDLGRYDEAEPLYQRALHIWEKQFGSEHYLVAIVCNNLADIYHEQGRFAEAESFYHRALSIFERQLGVEHYFIAYSLHGLANLYYEQGKYTRAEPLYQRALDIRERTWGPQHHETAESIHDLARLREAQGNIEEARAWYTRALTISEQALGVHHPKTTETRSRLMALLHELGQHNGVQEEVLVAPVRERKDESDTASNPDDIQPEHISEQRADSSEEMIGEIETEEVQFSLFAIARATLEDDDRILVGKAYTLQTGISQSKPEDFEGEPFDLLASNIAETLLFEIILHMSKNIQLTTDWQKSLLYILSNQKPQTVEFTFYVTAPGSNSLDINFYHKRRWLRTLHFEFDAVEQQRTAISIAEG